MLNGCDRAMYDFDTTAHNIDNTTILKIYASANDYICFAGSDANTCIICMPGYELASDGSCYKMNVPTCT